MANDLQKWIRDARRAEYDHYSGGEVLAAGLSVALSIGATLSWVAAVVLPELSGAVTVGAFVCVVLSCMYRQQIHARAQRRAQFHCLLSVLRRHGE